MGCIFLKNGIIFSENWPLSTKSCILTLKSRFLVLLTTQHHKTLINFATYLTFPTFFSDLHPHQGSYISISKSLPPRKVMEGVGGTEIQNLLLTHAQTTYTQLLYRCTKNSKRDNLPYSYNIIFVICHILGYGLLP